MKRELILICLILIGLSTSALSKPIINKAVGIWLFDEGEGQDVRDGTAHENHGKLKTETAWVGGKFGTAAGF